jgi:hypothetical protein
MKKTLLSGLSIIAFSLISNATVHTVSNDVNSPGQFTSAQAAHDAANSGDTLYIHATATSYGELNVKKPLVIIGEGSLPNKAIQYNSYFSNINMTFSDSPISSANGTKIFGLKIDFLTFLDECNGCNYISNFEIARNLIQYLNAAWRVNNALIYQNVINNFSGQYFSLVFTNNIVQSIGLDNNNGSNNLISNNIIENGISSRGAIVSNNIFYKSTAGGVIDNDNNNKDLTWTNNLFYAGVNFAISDIVFGTNTGTGNIINVNPSFILGVLPTTLIGYNYSTPANGPFANYHLQATSPGINYGTDGSDIGIYGGAHPWIDGTTTDSRYRYFTMPSQVPHMISMDVLNPTIPLNGTLNIQFNAKTQQ